MTTKEKFNGLIECIEGCGEAARAYFNDVENNSVQKADGSVVTEIDTKTEEIIRTFVEEHFPEDTIVGEEGEDVVGTSDFLWFIDPIDGTENFVRKIPLFSITAVRLGSTMEDTMAVVHNPITRQTFASFGSEGAYENMNLCNHTSDTIGGRYIINIGAGTRAPDIKSAQYELYKAITLKFGKSGTFNSALLEFAYVAAGRLDGFLSINHKPWDSAAGLYLAKSAGAAISVHGDNGWKRYDGAIKDLYGKNHKEQNTYFVSHPDIHDEILNFIQNPLGWSDT